MGDKDELLVLTKGSKYEIKSLERRDQPLVTRGIFRGLVAIGGDQALSVELDETHGKSKGMIRLIPNHMIISIDIIEAVGKEEARQKPYSMYG